MTGCTSRDYQVLRNSRLVYDAFVGERRDDVEEQALEQIRRADLASAATTIVRGYGAEIYGFLVARMRDETAATDAFSMFTEDLWRGLPGFEGRASLRVWAYTLARHAAIRHQAAPKRRRSCAPSSRRSSPSYATASPRKSAPSSSCASTGASSGWM